MDYKTLKESIERFRDIGHLSSFGVPRFEAAKSIADALLDQTPIDAEGLLANGFESRMDGYALTIGGSVLLAKTLDDDSLWFEYVTGDSVDPNPRNWGELRRLLLALEDR